MQTIETLLQEDNPLDMVLAEVISQHPELASLPKEALTVSKIKPATGDRNTEAVITAVPTAGVKGHVSVFYDRADLSKVYNQFGDAAVKPEIYVFADPGSQLTVNDILPKINAVFGVKMKTTGDWLDAQSFSFQVANRGGVTSIALTGKAGTADGSPPVSARVLPGKQFKIDVVNKGSAIGSKMTNREINPFITATGKLNWKGESITAAMPSRSLLLALHAIDFSDILNQKRLNQILTYAAYENSAHCWRFDKEIVDAIKARCQFLDIPIIDFTAAQQSGKASGQGDILLTQVFRDTKLYPDTLPVNKTKFAKMLTTGDSFIPIMSPTGTIRNVRPTIEEKPGWVVSYDSYPLYFNLV